MPAGPEVRYAHGAVRTIEVPREMEADHQAEAHRHVRICGKVKINLEHIRGGTPPRIDHARSVRGKDFIRNRAYLIRNENLFCEPDEEVRHPAHPVVERMGARRKLFGDGVVADDRPGDELREQGHIARECREILDGRRIAPPYVDRVAHRLERVERNTHGEQHTHNGIRRKPELFEHDVDIPHREHVILEETEHSEVHHHGNEQRHVPPVSGSARRGNDLPREIHNAGGEEHQNDEPRFHPSVKDVAEYRDEKIQSGILRLAPDEEIIPHEKQGQEIEKEDLGGKDHRRFLITD